MADPAIEYDISLCLHEQLEPDELASFIEQVESVADPVAFEVVAEGNFAPQSPEGRALVAEFANLTLLEKNADSLSANQSAIRKLNISSARYPALWSAHVQPLAGGLARLVDFLDENTETAVVAPRLLDQQGKPLPSYRRLPGFFSLLTLHSLLATYGFGGPWLRRYYYADQPAVQNVLAAEYLLDRALVFRREALEELDGLYHRFSSLYSDADYCRRCLKQGWYCHYLAGAVAREQQPERYRLGYLARVGDRKMLTDAIIYLFRKWLGIS